MARRAFGMTPNIKRLPSVDGMCVMCRRWWETIHKAAQTPHYKQAWKVLEKVSVQPILSTPIVLRLVQRRVTRSSGKLAQLPRAERLLCFKLADSIGQFLRAPAAPFDVGRRDVRRDKRDAYIATLLTKQLRNRVVRIVQEHHTWDQLRITSSLEQDPFFLKELLPYEPDVRIVSAIRQDHFSVRALGRRFQIAMERAGRTMQYDAVASFASASRRTARRWDR